MGTVTRRALRVYAALSELKTTDNDDILDALIPFFDPILTLLNGKVFEPRPFAKAVQKLYRWRFNADIAEHFIPRLQRKGILERKGTARDATYIVKFEAPEEPRNEQPIDQILNKIVDEFVEFPPRVTDLLNYRKTRDELTDLLIRFLVSLDAYSERELVTEVGRLESEGERELLSQIEDGGAPLDHDDRYMVARFVQFLCKERTDYLPHLARLASIGLLTEVVQDFVKPTQTASNVRLTVIVDAPLALDYLGCSGKDLQDDVTSIFDSLRKIGCSFNVFPISCEEMKRNLDTMLALPPQRRHGYTHNAMVRGEVLLDYVKAVAADPEGHLEAKEIKVRHLKLDQFPSSHTHFNEALYDDFFSYVDWVKEIQPREHDAACAALVMRLREGKQNADLFRTGFIFVTRNPQFARKSRAYCLNNHLISEKHVGPIIHQRELAVAAWLRTGLYVDQQIPARHLVAQCDRVLRVRPEVSDAVAGVLSKITPELLPQYEALLLNHRSVRKLADNTLNDERVVTTENAVQLLELMRQATAEEERAKHEAEMRSLREKHKDDTRTSVAEKEQLARQLGTTSAQLEDLQRRTEALFDTAIVASNREVKFVENFSLGLMLTMVAIAVFEWITGWLGAHWILTVIGGVAGIASTYHLLMDIRQRPKKFGLAALLNWLGRRRLQSKISRLQLSNLRSLDDVVFDSGQATRRANETASAMSDHGRLLG